MRAGAICREGGYKPCEPGTYKAYNRQGPCTPCPANSSSVAGAAALKSCTCEPGFSDFRPGGCLAFAAGKHKAASGPAPCADCPEDTYDEGGGAASPAACLVCQGNSSTAAQTGRSAETACVCDAGFYQVAGWCSVCARDRYCPGGGQIFDCPSHSQGGSGMTLEAQCVCDSGYYRNATRCLACAPDHWCDADAMTPCNHDSTSAALSSSEDDCVCVGGTARAPTTTSTTAAPTTTTTTMTTTPAPAGPPFASLRGQGFDSSIDLWIAASVTRWVVARPVKGCWQECAKAQLKCDINMSPAVYDSVRYAELDAILGLHAQITGQSLLSCDIRSVEGHSFYGKSAPYLLGKVCHVRGLSPQLAATCGGVWSLEQQRVCPCVQIPALSFPELRGKGFDSTLDLWAAAGVKQWMPTSNGQTCTERCSRADLFCDANMSPDVHESVRELEYREIIILWQLVAGSSIDCWNFLVEAAPYTTLAPYNVGGTCYARALGTDPRNGVSCGNVDDQRRMCPCSSIP